MPIDPAARKKVRELLAGRAADMQRHRLERAIEHIYIPRQPSHAVAERAGLYDVAAAEIGDVPLLYLEFGVFSGRSMRQIVERFRHPEARFIGFDSFEGLPEDWKDMPRGTFARHGRMPDIPDARVSFVKGWFQNTLPDFLAGLDATADRPVLVHYDADLYSSTLFILSSLWHRLPAYHFIFDEFMSEEIVALHDFSLAYPIELEFLCQTNPGGYPPKIFGRLRRVPLVMP